MEPESSLPYSQAPANRPYPELPSTYAIYIFSVKVYPFHAP